MNKNLLIGPLILLLSLYFLFENKLSIGLKDIFSHNNENVYLISEINKNAYIHSKPAIEIITDSNDSFYILKKDILKSFSSEEIQRLNPKVKCQLTYRKDKKTHLYNIVETINFNIQKTKVDTEKSEGSIFWPALFLSALGLFITYRIIQTEISDNKTIKDLELIEPTQIYYSDFPLRISEFIISRLKNCYVIDKKVKFELENIFNINKNSLSRNFLFIKRPYNLRSIEYFVLKLIYVDSSDKYGQLHQGAFVANFYIKQKLKSGLTNIYTYKEQEIKKGDYAIIKETSYKLINTISFLTNKSFKIFNKVDVKTVYTELKKN